MKQVLIISSMCVLVPLVVVGAVIIATAGWIADEVG